ncbi:hypothetical protein [Synechocystis sp. PCC 7338]|uniref:hypothetical protein n=1 Tax=Synechocystis sp. PCC 7338 TaxID=2732530 RepID=UPI001BB0264C|nr:hypothetical protein [Synechocystis sp. PCC 7338]QUS60310.1 hypothetical protein HTZ78_06220 [Synechocystis sp. PCC 7338]
MPRKANKLLDDFKQKVRSKELVRCKMEELLVSQNIKETDILFIYDGLFLNLFTDFEKFIEDLFFGLIKGSIYIEGKSISSIRKVKISPQEEIELVVLSGKDYLDWLPYDHTKKRAEIFLNDGYPFTKLNENQIRVMGEYHKIRNAIAHKSLKAQKQFMKIIQNRPLLPTEKNPSGYLRSKGSGEMTQYEIAARELVKIANDLCKV